jgi:ABC-type lipoprotein export system ATPase subunit
MKKIKSIEIKSSSFYNDLKIEFSEKLNCIMGGRGTGKTTLLYFIKSAIEENSEDLDIIERILKNNLGNGSINIEIENDEAVTYNITKSIGDFPQPYILPGQAFVPIEKIRNEITCDIYEAGRIEEIGRSSRDRILLLDKKVKAEITDHEALLNQTQIDLDANAQDIKTYNRRLDQMDEVISQYQNIEEEFENHKKHQPLGLKKEEKSEFEKADIKEKLRKEEKRFFTKTIEILREFTFNINNKKNELLDYYSKLIVDKERYENKELIGEGISITSTALEAIKKSIETIIANLNISNNQLNQVFNRLNEKHDLQQAEFIKLKQKFELNKEYINKYHTLSKKADEKKTLLQDKEELTIKKLKLKEQRGILIQKLNNVKQAIFATRLKAVKDLNASFNNDIIITLTFGGIIEEFQEKLKVGLRGSGMRYNELIPRIVNNFSSDQFANIIHNRDVESLKNVAGIDEARANAIIDALNETDIIYEIESMYCNDLPEFKLKIAEDSANKDENYRKTDELSMGQRCTTVLPIIFAVSNNPLIIDQPEDNLDNKYISNRIHEIIRQQKNNRQLIFITHNPNIPVLSDAEKNIFLLYKSRKSDIDGTGNVKEVKEKIVSLLEGGEEAFKKRIEIYGFQN